MANVQFVGLLGGDALARSVPGREGRRGPVSVPRDVWLRRPRGIRGQDASRGASRRGAIEETGVVSGGGLGYDTDSELLVPLADGP